MKAGLYITGSPAALIAILSNLPEGAAVDGGPSSNVTAAAPPLNPPAAAVTPSPMVAPPMPNAIPPMPTSVPPVEDDDDDGPADVNAPAIDSAGFPWDGRIHSDNKKTNKDGTWRRRRGVGDETVAAVEAELRAGGAVAAPVVAPPMPAPVVTPPVAMAPPPMPVAAPPMPVAAPPMPVATPAPAPVPVAAAPVQAVVDAANGGALDFTGFMQHISTKMTVAGSDGLPLIHMEYLAAITAEIATAFGQPLGAITDIAGNPAMITYAMQCLQRDGRW